MANFIRFLDLESMPPPQRIHRRLRQVGLAPEHGQAWLQHRIWRRRIRRGAPHALSHFRFASQASQAIRLASSNRIVKQKMRLSRRRDHLSLFEKMELSALRTGLSLLIVKVFYDASYKNNKSAFDIYTYVNETRWHYQLANEKWSLFFHGQGVHIWIIGRTYLLWLAFKNGLF